MKTNIRQSDIANRRKGGKHECGWIASALGLDEIAFPPPPPPRDAEPDWEDAHDDFEDEPHRALEPREDWKEPPPLPAGPMSEEDVLERLDRLVEELPDPLEAIEEMETAAPDLMDLLDRIVAAREPAEALLLLATVARAWFVFFPPGTRPERFDTMALALQAPREGEEFLRALQKNPKAVEAFLERGPQPALTRLLSMPIFELSMAERRKNKPKAILDPDSAPLFIAVLTAFIREADSAARLDR